MPRVVYKPKIHYRVHKMPPDGLSWIQSKTLHTTRIFDILLIIILPCRSWGSSVSIVSDYRVDDPGTIPGRGKGFSSSLCVLTGSGAHPASCTMGTGSPFPGGKARPGRDADHSPHLVPRSGMSRSFALIILPSATGSSKWSVPFRIPYWNFVCFPHFICACYMPGVSNNILFRHHLFSTVSLNYSLVLRSWDWHNSLQHVYQHSNFYTTRLYVPEGATGPIYILCLGTRQNRLI
jgi:hypothetical protein